LDSTNSHLAQITIFLAVCRGFIDKVGVHCDKIVLRLASVLKLKDNQTLESHTLMYIETKTLNQAPR